MGPYCERSLMLWKGRPVWGNLSHTTGDGTTATTKGRSRKKRKSKAPGCVHSGKCPGPVTVGAVGGSEEQPAAGAVRGSRPALRGREVMGLGSKPGGLCPSLSPQFLPPGPAPPEPEATQQARGGPGLRADSLAAPQGGRQRGPPGGGGAVPSSPETTCPACPAAGGPRHEEAGATRLQAPCPRQGSGSAAW